MAPAPLAIRGAQVRFTRLPHHRSHSLEVPSHCYQRPLGFHRLQTAQEKLAEAHHRFDDAEYRLYGLLTHGVSGTAVLRLQRVLHARDRVGRLRQRGWLGEALRPMRVVRVAARRQQRGDAPLEASLHVGGAEVTVIGHQRRDGASLYETLQILSLTMFETTPLDQLLTFAPPGALLPNFSNQLNLFES